MFDEKKGVTIKPVQWQTFEGRNGMKPLDWLIYGHKEWKPERHKTEFNK